MTNTSMTIRLAGSRCCEELESSISTEDAQQLSADFQILGHPVRLQILDVLAHHAGQVCVCDLEAAVPVKQPTVSHHLRLLREAGLIDSERKGQWMYYFICHDSLAALHVRVAKQLHSFVTPQV